MNVVVEEIGPCRKKLRIEIPAEEVAKEHAQVLDEVSRTASVKGFRPGKAPRKVVQARYGGKIAQEVEERLVPKAYRQAMKDKELHPVHIVDMEEGKYASGAPLAFSVTCDVQPDFELPEYKGVRLERKEQAVTDEQVDNAVKSICEQFATFEDVERAAAKGDFVQVDFEGVSNGKPIAELNPSVEAYAKGEDFWLPLEEDTFLPGFVAGITGTAPGERVQVQVDFPGDFREEVLRDLKATYFVQVKTVRERRVPELSEDLVKQLGMESEEALRARIREDLEARYAAAEQGRLKQEIINFLSGSTEVELPESLVAQETQRAVYDMVSDITRSGARREDIEQHKGEIFDNASRSAKERVKVRFILDRIAEKEEIAVTPQEFEQRIHRMAAARGMAVQVLRKELEERDALEDVEAGVRYEKTLDFLLDQAEVSE